MEKRLSDLKPGERGVISRIAGDRELRRRLLDMGLTRGTEIIVVRRAPLGDPVEFLLKGYNLSLRKRECEGVYVLVEEGRR
ncbi:MAG: iron transporter [Thaumarchaeota archaeon]|nr:ferrous iron transport protein A [Candidatus Bathyarchaeota archaeon]RLG05183.1 MAG: iron transporter [Nitrososphaerota archaeon]RLG96066.1 MAG: iron transporter [Candidatus Bathyarchaeota archaeon]